MPTGKILVADDNKSVLNALSILLKPEFEEVLILSNPNRIMHELENADPDVVLLDMNFRTGDSTGNEGIFWLRQIKKKFPHTEVVLFTAYGDVEMAVKALKEGACDFILKPWDNDKLLATLKAAVRMRSAYREVNRLKTREHELNQEYLKGSILIPGKSPGMKKVMDLVKKVAQTDANVLLTGENGTGKEVIAREIHRYSHRNHSILLTVDLGSIHENLFESELFGHKKGAFTDAHEDRTGKFLLADGGTLFLDEIGNLPLHLQSKLLSTLQRRMVTPVGSNKEYAINIRLICATNRNLPEMVKNQVFREDLLYRINTIHIELPPLRERKEDILLLANSFLQQYAHKYEKNGIKLNEPALNRLLHYHWPGNVRELQHVVEKAVILCDTNILGPEFFSFSSTSTISDEADTLESMERKMILLALDKHQGNLSMAASRLGITRQTLYNKLKKYGI